MSSVKFNWGKFNSLEYPVLARSVTGDFWPIGNIGTCRVGNPALIQIDVIGKLETLHFDDVYELKDGSGEVYDLEDFFIYSGEDSQ